MNKLMVLLFLLFNNLLFSQNEIGFIDYRKILDTLPLRKVAFQKIAEFEAELLAELKLIEKDIERIKNSPQLAFNPQFCYFSIKKSEYSFFYESAMTELSAYNKEQNDAIIETITKAISIVAERKNLVFVFEIEETHYRNLEVDITTEVIEELLLMEKE